MGKREIEICVISDIHLGSYGCHDEELNNYIKSIKPKILILNGDIFDGYVFNRKYFPTSHFEFIRNVLTLIKKGTEVYYITGNHDEFMRNFDEMSMLNLHKLDKLVLTIDEKNYWFFHGDVFDISMQGGIGKVVAKIGGQAYDLLIYINKWINKFLKLIGRNPYSLSKKVKDSVKKAVVYVRNYEQMSCEHAIKQGYDYVVNGHIHQSSIRQYSNSEGSVIYMNSGDWVENLTSLEYNNGEWSIYKYKESDFIKVDK
jgi:UDP-2,3-diacylglucosamine pyrophosphatase LpxH